MYLKKTFPRLARLVLTKSSSLKRWQSEQEKKCLELAKISRSYQQDRHKLLANKVYALL
jgi:hypothetical protein